MKQRILFDVAALLAVVAYESSEAFAPVVRYRHRRCHAATDDVASSSTHRVTSPPATTGVVLHTSPCFPKKDGLKGSNMGGRKGVVLSSAATPAAGDVLAQLAKSVFCAQGAVPLWQAFGINAILFAALSSKLSTMLTPSGLVSAMVLGTGLWATQGWKGWLFCVLYLFLGQAVTKVRFQEKEVRTRACE